jgi:hypothetical protein
MLKKPWFITVLKVCSKEFIFTSLGSNWHIIERHLKASTKSLRVQDTKGASKKTKEPRASKKHGHSSSNSSKQTKRKESKKRSHIDDANASDQRPPKKQKTTDNLQRSRKTVTQEPTKKKGTAISVPGEVSKRAILPVPPTDGELAQLVDDGTSSESAESSEDDSEDEEEEEEEAGVTDDDESD